MDSYKIQLFLHVAVAIVALGATFAMPFLQGWGEQRGVGATRMALEFNHYLEKVLVIPGAILLFLFGVGLIFDDATGYKDDFPVWLMIAIAWYIAAFAIAALYQRRNVNEALATLEKVEDDGDFPPAYMAASRRIQITGGFLAFSTIAITFLMVWKPGQ
jgi:hypothetical protein